MVARRGTEMHAAPEAVSENGNPAFARRTARHQRCWRVAIRLRDIQFTDCRNDICSPGSLPETTADQRAAMEHAQVRRVLNHSQVC
jgi:hypothetical protein